MGRITKWSEHSIMHWADPSSNIRSAKPYHTRFGILLTTVPQIATPIDDLQLAAFFGASAVHGVLLEQCRQIRAAAGAGTVYASVSSTNLTSINFNSSGPNTVANSVMALIWGSL